jgi:sialic acid synthase SpsE
MIISTGMATVGEIAEAVDAARDAGCKKLALLKCTSTYPASAENTNLRTIPLMRETFGCDVGLSDHTGGIGAAVAAVAFGAVIIEKHFTISRAEGGVDAAFSLEPPELTALVRETETAWKALGQAFIGPSAAEMNARMRRRSIYVIEDVRKGEVFTEQNLGRIRPGRGLSPKFYNDLLGKKACMDIKKGTPMSWDLI